MDLKPNRIQDLVSVFAWLLLLQPRKVWRLTFLANGLWPSPVLYIKGSKTSIWASLFKTVTISDNAFAPISWSWQTCIHATISIHFLSRLSWKYSSIMFSDYLTSLQIIFLTLPNSWRSLVLDRTCVMWSETSCWSFKRSRLSYRCGSATSSLAKPNHLCLFLVFAVRHAWSGFCVLASLWHKNKQDNKYHHLVQRSAPDHCHATSKCPSNHHFVHIYNGLGVHKIKIIVL